MNDERLESLSAARSVLLSSDLDVDSVELLESVDDAREAALDVHHTLIQLRVPGGACLSVWAWPDPCRKREQHGANPHHHPVPAPKYAARCPLHPFSRS